MSDTYYSPQGNPEIWDKKPTGYYTVDAWNKKTSSEAAAIQEEEARAYLTFDNVLRDKTAEVNTKFAAAMSTLLNKYPSEERDTFTTQELAAKSFIAGSSDYIAYLTTLAEAREITVPTLVTKILSNATRYHETSAEFVGTRHKYLDILSKFTPDTDPTIIRDLEVTYIVVA